MASKFPPAFFIQMTMAVLILAVNALIITTVWRSRRLHSRLYLLTANVAAADSVMGVAVLTRLVALVATTQPIDQVWYVCGPSTVFFILSAFWSVSGMLLICLERLVMVTKPNNSQWLKTINTNKCFKTLVVSAIVFSVLLALMCLLFFQPTGHVTDDSSHCIIGGSFIHPAYWQAVALLLAAISIMFIICHTYSMYRGRKNIQDLRMAMTMRHHPFDRPQPQTSWTLSPKALCSGRDGANIQGTGALHGADAHELRHAIFNMKLTITMTIVLILFIACWSPEIIILFLVNACPCRCHIETHTITMAGTLAIFNSFLNICVYSLRLREFRRELRHLFPCCRPSHVVPGEGTVDGITLVATGAKSDSCVESTRQRSCLDYVQPENSARRSSKIRIETSSGAHLTTIRPYFIGQEGQCKSWRLSRCQEQTFSNSWSWTEIHRSLILMRVIWDRNGLTFAAGYGEREALKPSRVALILPSRAPTWTTSNDGTFCGCGNDHHHGDSHMDHPHLISLLENLEQRLTQCTVLLYH